MWQNQLDIKCLKSRIAERIGVYCGSIYSETWLVWDTLEETILFLFGKVQSSYICQEEVKIMWDTDMLFSLMSPEASVFLHGFNLDILSSLSL